MTGRIESKDEQVKRAMDNIEIGQGDSGFWFRCKECGSSSQLESHIEHKDDCWTGGILMYRTFY